ncbi:MAG: aminoglycoside phosphotransferase family protein [Alphaproteobacteria bacterium]|nr:aminoglycoside phosphotransferase family protein [Alphaproteobacteria bacterium]
MLNEIKKFLINNYSKESGNIKFLAKGMWSSAYQFIDGTEEKIIRVNVDKKDFLKDKFAERFSCDELKVPNILDIGKFDKKYFYSISEKCEGKPFDSLTLQKKIKMLPRLCSVLLSIHNTNTSFSNGHGDVDINFNGRFKTWKESVQNLENHKIKYDWDKVFAREFFDVELFNKCKYEMEKLLSYIPEMGYLVHGDFGYDNVIVNDNNITGVIDWAEAKIGDFLYDIAWLDFWSFWSKDVKYSVEMKEIYAKANMDFSNYEERLKCYMLKIGLCGMAIASHFNKKGDYDYVVSRMQSL